MMRLNIRTRHLVLALVARIVIVVTLTFALVSGIAPLGHTLSGPLCTMACCAAMPPHEADSHTHGSCHANLSPRSSPSRQQDELHGAHESAGGHVAMHMHDAPPVTPVEAFSLGSPSNHRVDSVTRKQSS